MKIDQASELWICNSLSKCGVGYSCWYFVLKYPCTQKWMGCQSIAGHFAHRHSCSRSRGNFAQLVNLPACFLEMGVNRRIWRSPWTRLHTNSNNFFNIFLNERCTQYFQYFFFLNSHRTCMLKQLNNNRDQLMLGIY